MKVFEQAHRFHAGGDALAWALEIASWECRTELRRRRRKQATVAPLEDDPVDSPEAALERAQLNAALKASLAHLSAGDQEIVARVLDESFPAHADAAARKRKQRALGRLKLAWRSFYGSH